MGGMGSGDVVCKDFFPHHSAGFPEEGGDRCGHKGGEVWLHCP